MSESIYKKLNLKPIADVTDPVVIQNIIKHNIAPETVKMIYDADINHRSRRMYFSESGIGFVSIKSKAILNNAGKKYKREWITADNIIQSGENDLTAIIKNRQTKFIHKSKQITFEPKLFLNGIEKQPLSDIAIVQGFSLIWDYGFCKRIIENIEGRFREYYRFDSNPGGDFMVDAPFTGPGEMFSEPVAWDKRMTYNNNDYSGLVLKKGKKIVPKTFFDSKDVVYPLFVDDSTTIQGNAARDGHVQARRLKSGGTPPYKDECYYGDNCSFYLYDLETYSFGYFKSTATVWRLYRAFLAFDTDGVIQPEWTINDMNLFMVMSFDCREYSAELDDSIFLEYDNDISNIYPLGANESDWDALIGDTLVGGAGFVNGDWTEEIRGSMSLGANPTGFNASGWTYWSLRYTDVRADSTLFGEETAPYRRYIKFYSADAVDADNRPDLEITYSISNFALMNLLQNRMDDV
jgi:hypothetical protein